MKNITYNNQKYKIVVIMSLIDTILTTQSYISDWFKLVYIQNE